MNELTFVRFFLLLITGIVLFRSLLYISGRVEPGHLKKRQKGKKISSKNAYILIVCIYLLALLTGLVSIFAIIKNKVGT